MINLVYLHDLTSTVYDVANQPIPTEFEGASLLPIIRQHKNISERPISTVSRTFCLFLEQRMWRRKDYKLVFNAQ